MLASAEARAMVESAEARAMVESAGVWSQARVVKSGIGGSGSKGRSYLEVINIPLRV